MQEPFDIDFGELFSAVKRRWYITAVLMFICACGLTFVKGTSVMTYYETGISIIVGSSSNNEGSVYNIQDINLYQSYMNTYVAMLKTDKVIDQTIEAVSFNVNKEEFKAGLTAKPHENTQFFEVRLLWKDRGQAVELITTLADTFIKEMNMIYSDSNLHVMDKVEQPKMIVTGKPRRYIFMAGAIGGMILSFLIIFGLEFFDDTIKGEKEINTKLKSYLLAVIPKLKKNELSFQITEESVNEENMFPAYFMEAYRRLRTSLGFFRINHEINVISVTSSGKGEGKSITSVMLALCMALSGKKTLLIDGDIRKGVLSRYFNVPSEEGLVDILLKSVAADKAINENVIPKLDFLSAGTKPVNPSEILYSERLKKYMEVLKKYYDYIIIDTSPVGIVSDAQILTQYVDGTIITAVYQKTKLKDMEEAKQLIENVGGKVLGIVMTKKKITSRKERCMTYEKDTLRKKEKNTQKSEAVSKEEKAAQRLSRKEKKAGRSSGKPSESEAKAAVGKSAATDSGAEAGDDGASEAESMPGSDSKSEAEDGGSAESDLQSGKTDNSKVNLQPGEPVLISRAAGREESL